MCIRDRYMGGDPMVMTTTQLTQSSFSALQLPYSYIGLGRTNNYVENLNVGLPLSDKNSHQWSPIIPNSQLIVNPIGLDTEKWTLDIFVNPTKQILLIVGATIVLLIALGLFILHLHKKEKEEDERSQEQNLWIN
eukprot:TRINITY_DN4695_c0_g1_i5.p1 TRINITY_DN4695_c0_g1~~TRINITY_DN4695_c0_g1_i5.p1  ORF type:complete len:135 (-),score=29.87 TRINITY_DN4695_c0_g1_i5:170-574(-)